MKRIQKHEALMLGAILLLAAFLRLGWPGITEFKADEARLLMLAWDMAEGERFAVRGISSSVGVPNFPASVWVYSIPLVIWKHVHAATLFTGLLNTIAVGLCYWMVRRYWGWRAAVAAALMFAVSPWAVAHARKIWAQNLLAIFVLGWGISGLFAFHEGRKCWLVPHIVLATVAFQIHLAAVSLLVGSGLFLLTFRRHFSWKWLLYSGLGAFLTTTPFLYYLFVQSPRPLTDYLSAGGSSSGGVSSNAIWHTFRLFSGWQIHALTGGEQFETFLALIGPLAWLPWVWLVLGAGGLLLFGRQVRTSEPARFLLIWLGATVLTFIWFPTEVELHYLLPTLPVLFVASGVALAWLLDRWRPVWVWVGFGCTVAGQAAVWLVLLGFVAQQSTPGGFGELVRHQLEAVHLAQVWIEDDFAHEVLVAADGEEPEIDNVAAIYELHLRDIPHRFVNGADTAVFPQDGAIVLQAMPDSPISSYWGENALLHETVVRREDEHSLHVYALPFMAAPILENEINPAPLLANWVNFLGYEDRLTEGGWLLRWRVGAPAPVDYHFFNHLIIDGDRVAQTDSAGFGASQWHEGDVVISYFPFDLADVDGERPWVVRTGMYVYPSLENVPLLDEAANPFTDAFEMSLP